MKALSFWKAVTLDKSNLLDDIFALLEEQGIRFCVIGGQAVNAYVEPLVSLDLDLVVAVDQIDKVRDLLAGRFEIELFPHSINVSAKGSNLRVQIQTDPRYGAFVDRAAIREVLGFPLPVAAIEDVLQGKIWAALHPERRVTKRKKDLLDIERLLESYPDLRARVPGEIIERLS
ncbi:MAG: nucleotidyl transferase AbiEii/AbiGii toxin family protein [Bryobacteraceae bacterium]